jgi:hypothetical protein
MSTIGDNVLNMANLVKEVARVTKLDPMLVYRILELNVAYMSREGNLQAREIVEPTDEELEETAYPPLTVLDGGKTEENPDAE